MATVVLVLNRLKPSENHISAENAGPEIEKNYLCSPLP